MDRGVLWGIEIEFAADREAVSAALQEATGAGIARRTIARGGYTSLTLASGWVAGFDPSLRGDGHAPERCVEINTPPFAMQDWLGVARVLEHLASTVPHQITPRCGMHLHRSAADLCPADILSICRRVNAIGIAPTPPRRRFLRPLPAALLSLPQDATDEDLRREWFAGYSSVPAPGTGRLHPARRRLLNLGSFWYRGTIEFRWFPATLDTTVIVEAISLVQRLMPKGCA